MSRDEIRICNWSAAGLETADGEDAPLKGQLLKELTDSFHLTELPHRDRQPITDEIRSFARTMGTYANPICPDADSMCHNGNSTGLNVDATNLNADTTGPGGNSKLRNEDSIHQNARSTDRDGGITGTNDGVKLLNVRSMLLDNGRGILDNSRAGINGGRVHLSGGHMCHNGKTMCPGAHRVGQNGERTKNNGRCGNTSAAYPEVNADRKGAEVRRTGTGRYRGYINEAFHEEGRKFPRRVVRRGQLNHQSNQGGKMDNYHENKISQIRAIDEFFIQKPEKVKLVPAMEKRVGGFHAICVNLAAKATELVAASKGKTEAKAAAEEAMLSYVLRIRSNLKSVLREKKDPETLRKVALSDSEIRMMRDTDQKAFADKVYKLAVENAEALVEFNVTAEMLTDFKNSIDDYSTKLGKSLSAPGETSGIRKSVFALIRDAEESLDDIDDTIESYQEIDREFYDQYCLLRPVKNLGVRHRKASAEQVAAQPAK